MEEFTKGLQRVVQAREKQVFADNLGDLMAIEIRPQIRAYAGEGQGHPNFLQLIVQPPHHPCCRVVQIGDGLGVDHTQGLGSAGEPTIARTSSANLPALA